jgi:protocatechuate 3,4-dioxygenase beta subunit
VATGGAPAELVLHRQGSVKLRVLDKNGGLLRRPYTVTAKQWFLAQKMPGNAVGQPRRGSPDGSGTFEFSGLNPDHYVFALEADGHALTFSPPVEVVLGGEPPLVEVRLNDGGSIAGRVVDAQSKPLAGVEVATLSNDYVDNPLYRGAFRNLIPVNITTASATTDRDGKFLLARLVPGTYQLRFAHPDHFDVYVQNYEVVAGQVTAAAEVTLRRGTVVAGVAKVDGKPSPQVRVMLTAVPESGQLQAATPFTAEAITDNDGKFTLPKRVPPGRYQISAARQATPQLLSQIFDAQRTAQQFVLQPGQPQYWAEVNVPSQ